jgi:hypothetical protein
MKHETLRTPTLKRSTAQIAPAIAGRQRMGHLGLRGSSLTFMFPRLIVLSKMFHPGVLPRLLGQISQGLPTSA